MFKSTEASFIQLKGVAVNFFLSVFSGLSSTVFSFIYKDSLLKRTMALWSPRGVMPYMGYIGMCHCEGYGFQAVHSGIGYINQRI